MLQTEHQSHECALAAARRSDKGHIVAAVDAQVESVEEQGHIIGIAELQAPDVYPARYALDHLGVLLYF